MEDKEQVQRSYRAKPIEVRETSKTVKPGLTMSKSAKRFNVRGPAVGDPETTDAPKWVKDEVFGGEYPDVKRL